MNRKKWIVAKTDKEKAIRLAEKYNLDPLASSLLVSRGMDSDEVLSSFCSDDTPLCDPFELRDMDKAAAAINKALNRGEKITVYGDYDADGVTSTAALFSFLEMQGGSVDYYIPDRNTEGYGMNMQAIEKIAERGTKLIVTVDNGISALKESEYIYELGMRLVITDHHRVPERLPRAEAIVDPHRRDNPLTFDEWSGAGVAFKLICALSEPEEEEALLDEYADLVAIGTIADIVNLTGENRAIVKRGVEKINESERAGIIALKEVSGVADKTVSSTTVAFSLVPRINAIGRMKHAEEAVKLLMSFDAQEASLIAEELYDSNAQRQKTETEIMDEAIRQLEEHPERLFDRVLIFDGMNWHGGVIGIVASRFVERYGKPCIVITGDGEDAKGSGRSIEGFSLYDAISSASHLLTHFGGHILAAGFGIRQKDIPEFRKIVNDYAKTVKMPYPTVKMDFRIRPERISADILDVFSSLEPFGAGNPKPLFALYNMTLESVTPVGNGRHLRLNLSSNGSSITAMKFSTTPAEFHFRRGDIVDIAASLERNEYMGEVRVSVHVRDIKDAYTSDEKCIDGERLYEKFRRGESFSKEEMTLAVPDRKDIADVYKYIRQQKSIPDDVCILCYRLNDDGERFCKFMVALDILEELGLTVRSENGDIRLSDNQNKVDLERSRILQNVRNNF